MESVSSKACYQKALQILARRDHSCTELRKKLKSRGFSHTEIESATGECERLNYLNDARFAAAYLKHLQRKGHGINSIQHKLYNKGISKSVIQETVAPYRADVVQLNLCQQVLAKKLKSLNRNSPNATWRPKLQRIWFRRLWWRPLKRMSVFRAGLR